ncbi:hypothetical protein M408DRAFT_321252 [Serendipita vermifera MAFF 305830]|uniref:Uncharacterized protein n=1 Tax=Serendipita vermifera MAFF 305830 TaxID=933852 RepID=A0A0C2X194_SERVB|nr:hypothetical protein M408DRAFT_321252 [Serendipita vermifera MAFF 305830]
MESSARDGGVALSFSTPNLLSLSLKHVDGVGYFPDVTLFPDTSKLKNLTLFECFLPSFPHGTALQETSLRWRMPYSVKEPPLTIQTSTSLRALSLQTYDARFPVPKKFENLQSLEIHGFIIPSALMSCQMPMVTSLYLGCHHWAFPGNVTSLSGLNFGNLKELTLTFRKPYSYGPQEFRWFTHTIEAFLVKAGQLRHLKANRFTMGFVLTAMWSDLEAMRDEQGAPRKVLFRGSLTDIDSNTTVNFVGELGAQFLEELAAKKRGHQKIKHQKERVTALQFCRTSGGNEYQGKRGKKVHNEPFYTVAHRTYKALRGGEERQETRKSSDEKESPERARAWLLAGENGERCAQWSSLYVDFGPTFIRRTDTCVTPQLGIALSFPTPNLLSLTLKYVDGVKYFSKYNQFPNTNKLKSFTLFEAFLPTFPRSAALQKTSLRWCTPYKMNQSSLTMQTSTSLRALCLQTYDFNFPFPNQLEALQLLEIHGFILPTALTNCHMPMVTSLYLGCHDCGLPRNILTLCGLDFTRLEELTLTYRKGPLTGSFDDPLEPLWFVESTREFLTKACHLQHLKANRSTMNFVLRTLWTSFQPIPGEQGAPNRVLFRGSLTNIDSNATVEFVDELGTQFLEKLAAEWGCRDPSQDL